MTPEPTKPLEERSSGTVRKVAVAVAGSAVTAAGVAMLITPGPGLLAMAAGLGILGTEFPAARRTLNKLRRRNQDGTE